MPTVAELKRDLEERWGDHPSGKISIAIIEALEKYPIDELRMLTFVSFKNFLAYPEIDEFLIRAVNILTNTSIHALDLRLLLIDDDDKEFELEPAALEEAKREGGLPHPDTGELIEDYEAKVFPFFVPSDRYKEARAHV